MIDAIELSLACSTAQMGSLLHSNRGRLRASQVVKPPESALAAAADHGNGVGVGQIRQKHNCHKYQTRQKHNCHKYQTEMTKTADRKCPVQYVVCTLPKI